MEMLLTLGWWWNWVLTELTLEQEPLWNMLAAIRECGSNSIFGRRRGWSLCITRLLVLDIILPVICQVTSWELYHKKQQDCQKLLKDSSIKGLVSKMNLLKDWEWLRVSALGILSWLPIICSSGFPGYTRSSMGLKYAFQTLLCIKHLQTPRYMQII